VDRGRHRRPSNRRAFAFRALVVVTVVAAAVAGAAWYVNRPGSGTEPVAAAVTGTDPGSDTAPGEPGSPTPSPSETEPPPPRSFTIAATGDILIHSAVWERAAQYARDRGEDAAFDFRPMFAPIRSLLSQADLAVCHMETPVTDDGHLSSFPIFSVPTEVVDAVAWAGYDTCSTASNHTLDGGEDGIVATLDALDAAGIAHAGSARTPFEAKRITMLDVNGVKVAQLSYAYGFNGFQPPSGKEWLVNAIDPEKIVADAKRAKDKGAEFVIVSLHWGLQYVIPPTSEQQSVGKAILKSPAVDLVLGHHAHVVQPIGKVGKKYVVYGLGNLLSNMTDSCTGCTPQVQDGVIVHLTVEEVGERFRVESVRYTPTWVDQGTTWRILPVARFLDLRSTGEPMRSRLEASWRRTAEAITLLGLNETAGVIPLRLPEDRVG
jgi:poly-gamma-glutamate synthesis protein (capsule biosynthesis protein)